MDSYTVSYTHLGLEYSAVYFVGLEDGAFWSFKSQPDEDRCAFFVAISRAKKYLMFTYCSYRAKLRFPRQSHREINEFFELLQVPGVAEIQEIHTQYMKELIPQPCWGE